MSSRDEVTDMAQATITRTCGHTTTEQVYGKTSERERKTAWLRGQACRDCQRAAANAQAAGAAAAAGLPALTGSEKQIAWATTIRCAKLADLDALIATIDAHNPTPDLKGRAVREQVTAAREQMTRQTSAAWWIDRRSDSAQTILRALIQG